MKHIFLLSLFLLGFTSIIYSQTNLEKGNQYFSKRFSDNSEGKADPTNTNKAIEYYLKASSSEQKYIALLQAYEFKGSWTNINDETIRASYKKGIDLGNEVKDNYPNSPGIWYWYIANKSRWGDQVPITEAANEGILDDVKEITEKIIAIDPTYEEAGALRLLGGVHLKAPNIPFVLTWPSEDKAQEYLNRAYEIAPENAANTFYYAKMLLNEGKRQEAENLLQEFIDRSPRDEYLLVDYKFIQKGKELYHEEFD